jgi:hypothetical protein
MKQTEVRAELKRLHSPDAHDLETLSPKDSFGILVQAMVGPVGVDACESFDIIVCTVDWFGENMHKDIMSGRHYLFVKRYKYHEISSFLRSFCAACKGATWSEVAQKVSRIGKWEFEDYLS